MWVFLLFLSHLIWRFQFPATSPLPLNRHPSPPLPGGRSLLNHIRSSVKGKQKAHEPRRTPAKTVNVPLGQATYVCFFTIPVGSWVLTVISRPMLLVSTMENDHTFSSFASAGSRKRRRRKFPSRRSMMTNLRTTKRKMFLLQLQCLLRVLPGILNLFVHKINSLMCSQGFSMKTSNWKLSPVSRSHRQDHLA
jgi:hypothetical protein